MTAARRATKYPPQAGNFFHISKWVVIAAFPDGSMDPHHEEGQKMKGRPPEEGQKMKGRPLTKTRR